MDILLIGNFCNATGLINVSKELLNHLEERGYHLITAPSRPGRINRVLDIISTIIRQRYSYAIANVDVFSGPAFVWAEIASRLLVWLKKPFSLTLHGGNLPAFSNQWPKRVRNLLSLANIVTTPSLYIQKELKRYRGDIRYLPNALAIEHYPFQLRTNPNPRLCWLRAFGEIYNPYMAVDILAILRETFPDIHLTMIGPNHLGNILDKIKKRAEGKRVLDCITFTGSVPKVDVPSHLQKNDVFINTTRYESFGISVMEAGAVGLPIVTTQVGELPYLWTQEIDALLVPSEDTEAMAAAVKRVLQEPGLAERLSRNARRKAEQYDWSVILPMWETLFGQLLEDAQ